MEEDGSRVFRIDHIALCFCRDTMLSSEFLCC
jgi:hypothetical protein